MFQVGDVIDQYRLTEILGEGAYGRVFAAENDVSGLVCALKTVQLGGKAGEREMRALRQYRNISHPNLIRIHHAGISGEYLYYTMDLADGTIAEQHLSPAGLLAAAIKLADALAHLHAGGLLHRDIKPDNLLWCKGEPILGDISLVTSGDGASLSGTPGFLSPAILERGEAPTQWSDLYALAKSFYCLLSGNPPGAYPDYRGTLNPQASILLRAILAVCDGTGVFSSAADFRDSLKSGGANVPVRPRKRSIRRMLFVCGVLLLVLAVLAFLRIRRQKTGSAIPPGPSLPPVTVERPTSPAAKLDPPPVPEKKTKPSVRYPLAEKILRELHEADRRSEAENRAIAEQLQVYKGLQKKAREQAEEKYPLRSPSCMNAILTRDAYRGEVLESLVRKRAQEDPEFRCFYVMKEDLDQKSYPLYALEDHPEHAEYMRDEYRTWKTQLERYQRERASLLGR